MYSERNKIHSWSDITALPKKKEEESALEPYCVLLLQNPCSVPVPDSGHVFLVRERVALKSLYFDCKLGEHIRLLVATLCELYLSIFRVIKQMWDWKKKQIGWVSSFWIVFDQKTARSHSAKCTWSTSTSRMTHCSHHHHHQSLNREGRWDALSFLHFTLSSTTHLDLPNSRTVHFLMFSYHFLMFSYHLFPCLLCLFPPFAVPCKMVLARPDEGETRPQHCSLRFFTIIRRSSISCWILARTSSLVTWFLYEMW